MKGTYKRRALNQMDNTKLRQSRSRAEDILAKADISPENMKVLVLAQRTIDQINEELAHRQVTGMNNK